jgi:hypothetical protein
MSTTQLADARLLVLSDLHLELGTDYRVPEGVSFDIAVLAGDIHTPGVRAVEWAMREPTLRSHPVVLVPGNHEFYGCEIAEQTSAMRDCAAGSNVHVLHREWCQIAGVTFLGCVLWTDFGVGVVGPDGVHQDQRHAMSEADRFGLDGRRIRYANPSDCSGRSRPLRAEDTLALHRGDRDWLRRELARQRLDGRVVVVTHHGPTKRSIAARFRASWLTPAFVSDLPDEFFAVPALWVHGHTHSSFDYGCGTCRVVSNARGIADADGGFENRGYSPDRVLII